MKKTLLVVLACLLCFFIGYFTGVKSKPNYTRFNNPYKNRTIPKRIVPRIPRIPSNLPVFKKSQQKINTSSSTFKNETNVPQNKK